MKPPGTHSRRIPGETLPSWRHIKPSHLADMEICEFLSQPIRPREASGVDFGTYGKMSNADLARNRDSDLGRFGFARFR